MKSYNRIMIGICVILAGVFICVNLSLQSILRRESGRIYRVEINRIENEISENGMNQINLKKYRTIKQVTVLKPGMDAINFYEGNGSDYVIKKIGGTYYRFDYEILLAEEFQLIYRLVNVVLVTMAALILGVLVYIRLRLIKPFHKIREVPYELSRGNLSVGLKENKSRFFGRFVWGLDLLRENLEKQKSKELSLQKEKKTLVLSISHDIKTPLSAINLYAKAISKDLYDSEEKRKEIAENISVKVNEIECFVSEIIKASSEDFLSLEVQNTEFYFTDFMNKIRDYYLDKLSLLKIEFHMEPHSNCLMKGDLDRVVEVVQNIMENAIKYGDGNYITISVSSEEDYRLVTITNSGCSLPDNELPHIFESFWRGSNAGNNSGSGLGLYICRQLMKKMNGSIYAVREGDEMSVTVVMKMA